MWVAAVEVVGAILVELLLTNLVWFNPGAISYDLLFRLVWFGTGAIKAI